MIIGGPTVQHSAYDKRRLGLAYFTQPEALSILAPTDASKQSYADSSGRFSSPEASWTLDQSMKDSRISRNHSHGDSCWQFTVTFHDQLISKEARTDHQPRMRFR